MSHEVIPTNGPHSVPEALLSDEARKKSAEMKSSMSSKSREAAKPDDGSAEPLQRVEDDLLRVLSSRGQKSKPWTRVWHRKNPELQKVCGVIYNDLIEVQRLLTLRRAKPPANFEVIEQQIKSFINETDDDLRSLTVHSAWEYAAALQRFQLLLGDDEYIFTHLSNEDQREKKAKPGAWSEYLVPEKLKALLEEYDKPRPVGEEARARAVECLSFLYAQRSRYLRHQRAREELKAKYLLGLTLSLGFLLLLLLQGIYLAAKGEVANGLSTNIGDLFWSLVKVNLWIDLQSLEIRNALIAAATGALGSTLSGFYKLRDEAGGLNVLRSFKSAMSAQPFVGAVVGVLLWLLLKSSIVTIGPSGQGMNWTNLAIYCFLAGFSEPFFLGLVQRVAGAADKDKSASKNEPK